MKDMIKLVVRHFFIITVGILFITSFINLFGEVKSIPPQWPWQIMLTGAVGALPSFLYYFKNEPTKRQFHIRCVIHFALIEAIIMAEGALLKWYDNAADALIIFGVILLVYVFVWVISMLLDNSTADNINKALTKFNENEKDD